jgi:hypothetical protein
MSGGIRTRSTFSTKRPRASRSHGFVIPSARSRRRQDFPCSQCSISVSVVHQLVSGRQEGGDLSKRRQYVVSIPAYFSHSSAEIPAPSTASGSGRCIGSSIISGAHVAYNPERTITGADCVKTRMRLAGAQSFIGFKVVVANIFRGDHLADSNISRCRYGP